MEALAETLAASDTLLGQVAMPILLKTGNVARVKVTLLGAAVMAFHALQEDFDKTVSVEDQVKHMTDLILKVVRGLDGEPDGAIGMQYDRLRKGHAFVKESKAKMAAAGTVQ